MSVFTAELLGTGILILIGSGVVANVVLQGTKGHNSGWMVITTGWALAVFVAVVVAGPYSGAHLNPAVTLGLALVHKVEWKEVPLYMAAQCAGAFCGAVLSWLIHYDHFRATDNPAAKLAVFATSPAKPNTWLNLLSEVVATFVLILVILFFTGAEIEEPHSPIGLGSLGALPVALLVWAIGLGLGGTTGFAINPARDLGPRIAHSILPISGKGSSGWEYSWIPVAGPFVGATIASLLYLCLK